MRLREDEWLSSEALERKRRKILRPETAPNGFSREGFHFPSRALFGSQDVYFACRNRFRSLKIQLNLGNPARML